MDISSKSIAELKKICKAKKIKGYSNKNASQLIEMLKKYQQENTVVDIKEENIESIQETPEITPTT